MIQIILILGPGCLAWTIEKELYLKKEISENKTVLEDISSLIVYCLLIFILGNIAYIIFKRNVDWNAFTAVRIAKYGLMSIAFAIVLPLIKIRFLIYKNRKTESKY